MELPDDPELIACIDDRPPKEIVEPPSPIDIEILEPSYPVIGEDTITPDFILDEEDDPEFN